MENIENIDYVLYGDTDSLYINLGRFMEKHLSKDTVLEEQGILDFIHKLSKVIELHVNNEAFNRIQKQEYNSQVNDFKIKFKQEVIAKTILFVKKKKYSSWIIDEEGAVVDTIKTTGLEIVRSDTPEMVRPMLKNIMSLILKEHTDKEISDYISVCEKVLKSAKPEEISTNIGVHELSKYISVDNSYKKGTPFHIKAVANYRTILKMFKLSGKYEDVVDSSKVKIIYVKPNKFGFENMAFLRWPNEIDNMIQIDYNKQIEKVFLNKVEILLDPMNKNDLLRQEDGKILNMFF